MGGSQTATKWAAVIGLWEGFAVVCGEGAPECVGVLRLRDAFWGEEGIGPSDVPVSVLGGPVALFC